jgi:uncharacterized SAM-binding protein YcdF (DUF218 family)
MSLILLWFTRRQKEGKVLITIGAMLLLLLGNRGVSAALLRPLERRYSPLALSSRQRARTPSGNGPFIVVLGGSYSTDPRIDVASRLGEATLARLVGGVELYREVPGSKLILSGGPPSLADSMAKVALALGVNEQDIILEKKSRNTEDEALYIAPIIGEEPFVLVTSASHMPRAMGLFKKLRVNPIAASTDFLAKSAEGWTPGEVYPSYYGLYEAGRAVYEYLGITWEKLNGEI